LALCIAPAAVGKDKVVTPPDKGTEKENPGQGNGHGNDPDLVAWWQLDDASGTSANDASPGQHHGKLKGGPAWTKGYKGGALKLDGKNDYIAITKAFFKRKDIPAVTVAAWIRTSSPNSQVIASFDRDEYWELGVNGVFAKNGQAGWTVTTNAGQINLASQTRVDDGHWHHVAGVFDHGQATIYVDGIMDATKTTGQTIGRGNRRYGFLGVGSKADRYDGTKAQGGHFAGDMDDVRIYSRALTDDEIAQLAFFSPANDDCQFAELVTEVTDLPFDTTQATADQEGLCMRSPNIWFLYAPSATGEATVSLLGSQYDTMLSVYLGAACSPGLERLIGCNDDFGGLQSQLTFDVVGGEVYLVEIGGWDRRTGLGVLTISLEAVDLAESDLGDAPDSSGDWAKRMTAYPDSGQGAVQAHFPTVFDDSDGRPRGPKHQAPLAAVHLGLAVSLENEADEGIDEDVVNNINRGRDRADQDGADDALLLPLTLPHGDFAEFDYIVTAVQPHQNVWVNVWFDWNRDGDWDDDSVSNPEMTGGDHEYVSEWAVQNQFLYDLPVGAHHITTPAFRAWHRPKGPEEIWMRITLSDRPWMGGEYPGVLGNGGSGPSEPYEIGETEDHLIVPETAGGCSLCEDLNGDGKIDFDDLIELIYKWLGTCAY
jgi:hypothetical protein